MSTHHLYFKWNLKNGCQVLQVGHGHSCMNHLHIYENQFLVLSTKINIKYKCRNKRESRTQIWEKCKTTQNIPTIINDCIINFIPLSIIKSEITLLPVMLVEISLWDIFCWTHKERLIQISDPQTEHTKHNSNTSYKLWTSELLKVT